MNRFLLYNLIREVKKNTPRFLSIFAISALGCAFFAGIRAASPDMIEAGDRLFERDNLSDLTVMSSQGLTEDDINAMRAMPQVEMVQPELSMDAMMTTQNGEEQNVHLISLPIKEPEDRPVGFNLPSYDIDTEAQTLVNVPELTSGRFPLTDKEVALDDQLLTTLKLDLGDYVTFRTDGGSVELRVVGGVFSPKYVGIFERGNSTIGNGSSDGFAYAGGNALGKLGSKLPIAALLQTTYTQAEVVLKKPEGISSFSQEYDDLVAEASDAIEAYGETVDGSWYVDDRSANAGYSDYRDNTERIAAVGDVFPLIFFIVAALVSLTTMTRMVEEQRIEMGTLKALGYNTFTIACKYMLYAGVACVSGGMIGCVIGFKLFPGVILSAYSIMYRIPDIQMPFRPDIAWASILSILACTGLATLAASGMSLKEVPATLMRPKAPKAGKRVILERIPFLWKRFNFTWKVTVRNILRYKKRFFMSIVGIAGSCSLLVTGFGVKKSIFGIVDLQFNDIWQMDIQAYTYEPLPREEMENLLESNPAYAQATSVMYCNDTICDAQSEEQRTGNVHVLAVRDNGELQGKIQLREMDGTPLTLGDDGAIITYKLAEIFDLEPGDTFSVISGGQSYEVTISAIAESYVHHYVYMSEAYYQKVFDKTLEYNGFMLNLAEGLTEADRNQVMEDLLKESRMYTVQELISLYEDMNNTLGVLNYVTLVLIVGSALLTFVVMLNLTNINLGERKRELATLRVLGFYDKEMYQYIFRENNTLAVVGAAVGLAFGKVMHTFVIRTCEVDLVMFVRDAGTASYCYSFLLTVVFSMLVNLMMRKKVRSIDMVESLKSAE